MAFSRDGSFLYADENAAGALHRYRLATSASASGGTILTIRGSGFQSGATVTIGGKSAAATFKDMNTLSITTPVLPAGTQQIVITNPGGFSYTLDAGLTAI